MISVNLHQVKKAFISVLQIDNYKIANKKIEDLLIDESFLGNC